MKSYYTRVKQEEKEAKKLDTFLQKIKNKPYDYSKMVYINSQTPIKIICKEHGEFEQIPQVHVTSYGICPKCALIKKGERFLIQARVKFKTRYSYDKFEYKGSIIPSIFICKEHGEFESTPTAFLMAKEPCSVCRGIYGCTTEEFIKKAQKIHGDKYDYSLVKYYNSKTAVQLICKKHGSFWKTPDVFLNQSQGCVSCNRDQQVSRNEIKWLNSLLVPIRSYKIDNYIVDGFNPISNTIYEYLGDYWHGNLSIYKAEDINKSNGESFGELNRKTFERVNKFLEAGYKVEYIWESDYITSLKAR